eukprot:4485712-Pyramimonas_sp.AAC.1
MDVGQFLGKCGLLLQTSSHCRDRKPHNAAGMQAASLEGAFRSRLRPASELHVYKRVTATQMAAIHFQT